MIMAIHYHYFLYPDVENSARTWVPGISSLHVRLGVNKPLEEVVASYRDYFDNADGDKLIQRMDEAGIDVSVLLSLDFLQMVDDSALIHQHEVCTRVVARHPDMGYYPNSEESYEILKVCNEFDLLLLTHCSPLRGTRAKYAEPIRLDDITLDFPNINVIAAHSGMMWWHDWITLAKFQPRLSGDLAMWTPVAESKPELFRRHLREILDIIGHEQLLFATNGPFHEVFISNK
jgi:hypothetical protein